MCYILGKKDELSGKKYQQLGLMYKTLFKDGNYITLPDVRDKGIIGYSPVIQSNLT